MQEQFTPEAIREKIQQLKRELAKLLVGQEEAVQQLLICLLSGGHALLTGVPGLGKTLLAKSMAKVLKLEFRRIQFTPDLMPADIFGTEVLDISSEGHRSFRFIKGPLFTNLLLADEINRTPPKTQAALLEAMGERQVSAAGKSYQLDKPFFVLATRNPIESEGTYPLPEAELDRFMLNINMDYLSVQDEMKMVSQTTSPDIAMLEPVLDADALLAMQSAVREVPVPQNVIEYAVKLAASTRPNTPAASKQINAMLKWGAGSRASQALILAGKARAIMDGRKNVAMEDVQALALPVLRHRVVLSFRAMADNITAAELLTQLVTSN